MSHVDDRGCDISGATPEALQAYERSLDTWLSWRSGADVQIEQALCAAPDFVMAHVLQAYQRVCSRDRDRVRHAQPILQHAAQLPANEREAAHLAVIAAALDDDFAQVRDRLAGLLQRHPRDLLALHAAHALDYASGNAARMNDRVAALLPAWSSDLPGYHTMLSMHAFGLVESGETERAEQAARAALALNPFDARAHHVMAHVFETSGRAEAGLRWMNEHAEHWATGTVVSTHGWWHVALFHLALGQIDRALALYDLHVRSGHSHEIADLIDAASLLWRIELLGGDAGSRWFELAQAWAPRIADAYSSFNDLHAMLAFVGARNWELARQLETALSAGRRQPTRHGRMTRELGLRACRGLMAFGRGNNALAIAMLARLPARVHRLGGSYAQRDVLHLTMLQALERIRRPMRRRRRAPTLAVLAS